MVRNLVRVLSTERVVRKRLPADLGGATVLCSPDAMLSMWKPGWRSQQTLNLFQWVRRFVKEGEVVWDIGANQGLFAFAAADRAGVTGQVVAVEPDPFLVHLLQSSRRLSRRSARVDILPIAVSGREALETLCLARHARALNHLSTVSGNSRTGGDRDRLPVISVTLDWLLAQLPPPTLIKIDVEGAELIVLSRGATQMLYRVRPRWIVEVAGENATPIASIFREAGYRLFDANAPESELVRPAWNTLAVPEELCRQCCLSAPASRV